MDFLKIAGGDLKDKFIAGWETAFERKLDHSVYDWVFNDKNNVYGVLGNGLIVAGYCLMEFDAVYNSLYKKGLLCNNVYVNGHKYHKLGLFRELTEFSVDQAISCGYDFAVGFPNGKAIKAHLRSGWQEAPTVPVYELNPENFKGSGACSSNARTTWYSSRDPALLCMLGDIEQLSDRSSDKYNYSSLRDKDHLAWRYIDNPRYTYEFCFVYDESNELNSVFIAKYYPANNKVHIVDFVLYNYDQMSISVQSILDKYKGHGVDLFDCWAAGSDAEAFVSVGFKKSSMFTHFIYRGFQDAGMEIGTSCHVALGDNDVY